MLFVLSVEVYSYAVLYKWPGSDALARALYDRLIQAEAIHGQVLTPYPTPLYAAKLSFKASPLYRIRIVRGLVRGTYRGLRFLGRLVKGKK